MAKIQFDMTITVRATVQSDTDYYDEGSTLEQIMESEKEAARNNPLEYIDLVYSKYTIDVSVAPTLMNETEQE